MSPLFGYSARDVRGLPVSGTLEAVAREEAFDALRVRALTVTSLHAGESVRGTIRGALSALRPCASERIVFFRTASTLAAAGIPLMRSLEVSRGECAHAGFREALAAIAADIEGGSPLHAAMARRPREFDAASCAIVRAGESSGTLEFALERVAALLERRRSLRKRIGASLSYPAVVAVIAVGSIGFLTASIVPMVGGLLAASGDPLPWFTRVLLTIGNAIVKPSTWMWAAGVAAAAAFAATRLASVPYVRALAERVLFAAPVVGGMLKKADTASSSRTLATLVRTGVGISHALALVRDGARSVVHRRALESVARSVTLGQSLSAGFAASAWYPPTFLALVRAGEEAGALDDMLLRAADYQEAEVDTSVAALSAIVEPVLIVVLGAVVGGIVAAVLIPLYSAIGRIQ